MSERMTTACIGSASRLSQRHIGATFDGTRYDTYGDKATFMNVADALPYFPASAPITERACYWKWLVVGTEGDVIVASMLSVWRAVAFALEGRRGSVALPQLLCVDAHTRHLGGRDVTP